VLSRVVTVPIPETYIEEKDDAAPATATPLTPL